MTRGPRRVADEPEAGALSVRSRSRALRLAGRLGRGGGRVSSPSSRPDLRLVMTTRSMAIRIQTAAVTTVIFVKVSPALVPKALEPPTPPNAPASPPPLPRWIRIRQIRKREVRTIRVLKTAVKTPKRVVLQKRSVGEEVHDGLASDPTTLDPTRGQAGVSTDSMAQVHMSVRACPSSNVLSRLDDGQEIAGLEAGPADQGPVDIGTGQKLRRRCPA